MLRGEELKNTSAEVVQLGKGFVEYFYLRLQLGKHELRAAREKYDSPTSHPLVYFSSYVWTVGMDHQHYGEA
jgi:hypothetical protein